MYTCLKWINSLLIKNNLFCKFAKARPVFFQEQPTHFPHVGLVAAPTTRYYVLHATKSLLSPATQYVFHLAQLSCVSKCYENESIPPLFQDSCCRRGCPAQNQRSPFHSPTEPPPTPQSQPPSPPRLLQDSWAAAAGVSYGHAASPGAIHLAVTGIRSWSGILSNLNSWHRWEKMPPEWTTISYARISGRRWRPVRLIHREEQKVQEVWPRIRHRRRIRRWRHRQLQDVHLEPLLRHSKRGFRRSRKRGEQTEQQREEKQRRAEVLKQGVKGWFENLWERMSRWEAK